MEKNDECLSRSFDGSSTPTRPHRIWVASGVDHVRAIYHRDWKTVALEFLDEHTDSSARANVSASFGETGTPPNRAR